MAAVSRGTSHVTTKYCCNQLGVYSKTLCYTLIQSCIRLESNAENSSIAVTVKCLGLKCSYIKTEKQTFPYVYGAHYFERVWMSENHIILTLASKTHYPIIIIIIIIIILCLEVAYDSMRLFHFYLHYIYDLILYLCIMYYSVCYLTGIFYAVVRQISMLFIDNKISVFCIFILHLLLPLLLLVNFYQRHHHHHHHHLLSHLR